MRIRTAQLEEAAPAAHRSAWLCLLLLAAGCGDDGPPAARDAAMSEDRVDDRPARWARPVDGTGLPNFHRLDERLYRGAQPEEGGFAALRALGVKTVVNLRTFHSDRDDCREHGLAYVPITVQAWEAEEEEVIAFLRIVCDPERAPVFVHCQHGADRTGMMCAIYRMVVQGWSEDEAVEEMTRGGFGFHAVWRNLVNYARGIDVEHMRTLAGVDATSR